MNAQKKFPKIMLVGCSFEASCTQIKSVIVGSPSPMFINDEDYENYKAKGYVLSNMIDTKLHFTIKHIKVPQCEEYYVVQQNEVAFYIYLQKSGFILEHDEKGEVVKFLEETYKERSSHGSYLFD